MTRRPTRLLSALLPLSLALGCPPAADDGDGPDPEPTEDAGPDDDDAGAADDDDAGPDTGDDGGPDTGDDGGPDGDDAGPDTGNDGGPDDDDAGPGDVVMGNATLTFEPRYGSGSRSQIIDSLWRPSVPGFEGQSPVVILLCELDDPDCEAPVWTHEVGPTETDGDPIQSSFGPAMSVTGVPEGTFGVAIFSDSLRSRELGLGWEDDFPNKDLRFGGIVSEFDTVRSEDPASAVDGNPAPFVEEVTLSDGMTTDLGVVLLGHFYQRDVQPDPVPEAGLVAVATDIGLRVIDLETHTVRPAFEFQGNVTYDVQLVDEDDNIHPGEVCGIVDAGDGLAWVLLADGNANGNAGYAVPYNVVGNQQLAGGASIVFPGSVQAGGAGPCRGTFVVDDDTGDEALVVWPMGASGGAESGEGLWIADTTDWDGESDLVAAEYTAEDDPAFGVGIDDVVAHDGELFLAVTVSSPSEELAPCTGKRCVLRATLNGDALPTFAMDDEDTYTAMVGPDIAADFVAGGELGTVTCGNPADSTAVAVGSFHDGRDLVFLGSCLSIEIFDAADGQKLDYNGPGPGRPGLSAVSFGEGFNELERSPDGTTVWAASQSKSRVHFNLRRGDDARQTFDRHMALPIDLTQGSLPGIHPDFNAADLDDFSGDAGFGLPGPAVDPGLDLEHMHWKRDVVRAAGGLAGSVPVTSQTGLHILPTQNSFLVRGSGISGNSGLGTAGNLQFADLATQRMIMWPRGDAPFYEVWTQGKEATFGFDLTPENDNTVATRGFIYVRKPPTD